MKMFIEGNKISVRGDYGVPPAIYFDQWALYEFSENLALQDRFVNAFHAKGGTFVLSTTNLEEFSGPCDPRHAVEAEVFLNRLLPNVYLTNFDLNKAEAFENDPALLGKRLCPAVDEDMLKYLAICSSQKGRCITFSGFIQLSYEYRDRLGKASFEKNTNVLAKLNEMRADPTYVNKARNSVPDTSRTFTKIVMGELMRELTIDPRATITINDVMDWQHSMLSLLCCDFVLLDGKWEQRALTLRRRVEEQNLVMPLAECFSKRDGGIDRFLAKLESFGS